MAETQTNLFMNAEAPHAGERFDELLRLRQLVIERIVGADGTTGAPCSQPQDEWVVLLRGEATLDVDGATRSLVTGDHVFIAAGTPHTVLTTSNGALWLAVHLHPERS